MVDYGRNLVGNIKVKTRSSGGNFVDIGKAKSDIDKNIREMEKLADEIKADPEYSSDSGKMINDLKEDIRRLKLIKYDNQGKPTEESLMAIYGKDVKNAKINPKFKSLIKGMKEVRMGDFMSSHGKELSKQHKYNDDSSEEFLTLSEEGARWFKRHGDAKGTTEEKFFLKVGNSKFKDKDGTLFEISQYPNGAWYYEIFDGNGHRIGDVGPFRYEDDAVVALKRHNSTVKKISNAGVPPIDKTSKSGTSTSGKSNSGAKKSDGDKSGGSNQGGFTRVLAEVAEKDKKAGNISIKTKTAGGKLVSIGDTEGQIKINIDIYKDSKKRYEHRRDQYKNIVDYYQKDLDKVKKFKEGAPVYIQSLNELVDRDVLARNTIKTLEGRIKDNEKEVKFYEKLVADTDYDIKAMEDALKKVKIGNKNVVTLKSIPKRIDLDKKSDLEKAIKDITDLSKDYEHGIKVNDDDKYMHDKFVGLLKEANDEVKELKKVLAGLH